MGKVEKWSQPELEPFIFNKLEPFPMGCRGSRVFCGIANHFGVSKYAITSYHPGFTYKHDPGQKIYWQEGLPNEAYLYRLGQELRIGEVFDFEGETLDCRPVIGACSAVQAGGQKCHIPMLDFCIETGKESLKVIQESVLLPPGVFLNSGNSYHYYGYDLMPEREWRKWMNDLGKGDKLDEIVDGKYLEYSLERGYGALRLFGYPKTDKPKVPVVVGYANLRC
jgi:hypothetical protein